jgi:hypothetical protein
VCARVAESLFDCFLVTCHCPVTLVDSIVTSTSQFLLFLKIND